MVIREKLIQYFIDYQDAVERNALAETPEESADYIISLMPGEGQVKKIIESKVRETSYTSRHPEDGGIDLRTVRELLTSPELLAKAICSLPVKDEGQVKGMLKNLIYEMWAEPKPDSVCDRCELEGREWQPAYATETIDRTTKAICSLPVKKEIDNG